MTDDNDELDALLKEWQDPKPGPELDSRMLSSYRKAMRRGWLQRFWPVTWVKKPALAFALVACYVAALVWVVVHRESPTPVLKLESSIMRLAGDPGYVTKLDTRGFVPVKDVRVRIIRKQEGEQ